MQTHYCSWWLGKKIDAWLNKLLVVLGGGILGGKESGRGEGRKEEREEKKE